MNKHLAFTAAIAFALTGCATSPQGTQTTANVSSINNGIQQKRLMATYQCEKKATVIANHRPDNDRAILTINVPSWQLVNQEIVMNSAISGSGMRFINHTNPNSLYEWHAKGRDAILMVTISGTQYSLACQGVGQSM